MEDYTELLGKKTARSNKAYTRKSESFSDTLEYLLSACDFFSILLNITIITFVILFACTVFGLIFVNLYSGLTFGLYGRALLIIGVAFVGYIMTIVLYAWHIPQKTILKIIQKITWFIFMISLFVLWLSGLILLRHIFEEVKKSKQ